MNGLSGILQRDLLSTFSHKYVEDQEVMEYKVHSSHFPSEISAYQLSMKEKDFVIVS